ncbi:hypothetical protein RJ640_017979 [Escallonia rubra]|uniref:Argonaute 2 n=1 Tax=Escallonia rubra TaxID=112253 RepID=A0AA88QKZ8_9ASTE|nr:hypothetical protein RJ640_017979 [Escallonia rubra]
MILLVTWCCCFIKKHLLFQFLMDLGIPDIKSLNISDQQSSSPSPGDAEYSYLSIERPDSGGTHTVRSISILVNHFRITFNPETAIMHYQVGIRRKMSYKTRFIKKPVSKDDQRKIKDKMFSDFPDIFPTHTSCYDGEKNIYSVNTLPTGEFEVNLSDGEENKMRSYTVTLKLLNVLKLSKLVEYLSGTILYNPRDILQAMDVVMKENPSRHRVSVGRSSYSREFKRDDDLHCGVAAFKGFQQSIKPTAQGLALCLDYSVMPFRKRISVLDFLQEHVWGFKELLTGNSGRNELKLLRRPVTKALRHLKVTVIHRATKQKFTIAGLSDFNARDLSFAIEDPEGKHPPREIGLVSYFREKYNKEITYKDIPCLDLGKNNRKNYVPMEFCILAEGQRYPKDDLDKNARQLLKNISLAQPKQRKNVICEMLRAEDGPCGGDFIRTFGIGVDQNMTSLEGRVIEPPELKFNTPAGSINSVRVDNEKCRWSLAGKSLVEGRSVEQWALIDFSSRDRSNKLNAEFFIRNLRGRLSNLGISMKEPLVHYTTDMHVFSNISSLHELLHGLVGEAHRKSNDPLQIIICVMAGKHQGYKNLKWVSETQIGVVTQCCLSSHANKGDDQFFANLALKINAKLGGSNVELIERLPGFADADHVMIVGADVNHPGSLNTQCPSIAAVVATVNWPAANRYSARVSPQENRKEKILSFGGMCLDLIKSYTRVNKVKPNKIVVFRDGVSEGQFNMVANEELRDLKRAIYEDDYQPTITLVVAQKRHQTRLFLEDERDGGSSGNVPPGTVVDTIIVHASEFDFYLCSHFGSLGTSRPTHYHVIHDENHFTSDKLQKLIYHLCFTFARCTKPVALVTPVYYADLVAYRGRLFQEAVKSTSPSAASFDEKFYKLHHQLENQMFFV